MFPFTTSRVGKEAHQKLPIERELSGGVRGRGHGRGRRKSSRPCRRWSPRRRPPADCRGRRQPRRRCSPRRRAPPCGRCSTFWSSCGQGTRCRRSPPSRTPSSSPAASAAGPPSPAAAEQRQGRRRKGRGRSSRSRIWMMTTEAARG